MNSRAHILNNIKKSKPELFSLPEDFSFYYDAENPMDTFKQNAEKNGAKISSIKNTDDIQQYILQNFDVEKRIINTLENKESLSEYDPHDFSDTEVVVIEGKYGVAENAAIWFTETELKNRALPFITQNLIVVLKTKDIVPLMHHAYEKIENTEDGFSIFISGPSKTADIEQSLVIGAHGSRSHHILLCES